MLGDVDEFDALGCALDGAAVSLEVVDADARILFVNEAFERATGYASAEVLGQTPREVLRSDYHTKTFLAQVWRDLEAGRAWSGHLWSRVRDGRVVMFDTLCVPITQAGRLQCVLTLRRDATERARDEERYQAVISGVLDAVLIADWDGAHFVEANPAAHELFGYTTEEFKGKTGRLLCASGQDEVISRFSAELHKRHRFKDTLRFVKKDGTVFWADCIVFSFDVPSHKGTVTMIRDVDERVKREQDLESSYAALRDAQAQLLHASQLATMGQLAAGVAHEINNPVNYVDINLSLMREKLDALGERIEPTDARARSLIEEMRELCDQSREGAERIASITRDLRTYGRLQGEDLALVDVPEIVRTAVRMAQNEVRHVGELATRFSDVPPVLGSGAKLGQVVMNLLMNAAHAIAAAPRSDGHQICVSVSRDGDAVRIVVSDTGTGIPEALRAKVFEPFFTTKPVGHGTGLGLSLCAEIVRQHQGTMRIDSVDGQGASVEVRLPAAQRHPEPRASQPPVVEHVGRSLRVLLIDDEPEIRRAFTRVLKKQHEVIAVDGGAAAVALLAQDAAFDVIVCDLMMPNLDGADVFAHVEGLDVELSKRMLFVSGGAVSGRTRKFWKRMGDRVLEKPVKPDELTDAVMRLARTKS